MTEAINLFGVDDEFGAGGIGIAPDGASGASSVPQTPPFTQAANVRDYFRLFLGSKWSYGYANSTALTNSLAVNRQDGQEARKLDDYSSWIWKAADTTAADANHIKPTDVGSGAGRWVSAAFITDATGVVATDSTNGLMSAADKTKLDGYPAGGVKVFRTTLTAGSSSAVSCPGLASTSRIALGRAAVNASTALGELIAAEADRVFGGSGSFIVRALTLGTPGTPLAGDLSDVDVVVFL